MTTQWFTRTHAIADTVTWIIKLNAWWWLLTAAGAGLFGAAPATAATAAAVRQRDRGDPVRFGDVIRTFRTDFVRANLALTPAVLALLVLGADLAWSARTGQPPAVRVSILVAAVLFAVACCYLGPLYAAYEMPKSRYIVRAVKITLARPLWSVLIALITAAIAYAASRIPPVALFAAAGAWVHACTWLALRFFADNERRLATGDDQRAGELLGVLPREPLRLH